VVLPIVALSLAGCTGLLGRLGCAGAGYDPQPYLNAIRPSDRATLPERAGLSSLAELPLYTIDLRLDLELLSLAGHQEVLLRNRYGVPIEDVMLRLYPNARQLNVEGTRNMVVENVTVDGAEAVVQEVSATTLRVQLPETLEPDESMTLAMDFRGTLPRYRSSRGGLLEQGLGQILELLSGGEARGADYGIYGYGDGIANLALWYPRLADRTDRGWDASDPAEVGDISTIALANYRVSVTTVPEAVVVTTGSSESEEELEGRVRRTFVAGAVRSFAIQASRQFIIQERQVGEVTVRAVFDREHALTGVRMADTAATVLQVYERRFGLYPYAELDVVEAPLRGGAGGVEWPGLVTISRSLLEDPNAMSGMFGPVPVDGPSREYWDETLEFVVAHEIAHQYWNAVVGSDSRNHPFLDESLAQFSAAQYFSDHYGAERGRQVMERQVRLNYHLHRLMGGADGAVDQPVESFTNVIEYAGLVYGKGPYYLIALRDGLDEGAFWQGMQTYYGRFAFRVAGPADLPAVMSEVSANAPLVEGLTRRWLYESHGDEDLGSAALGEILEPILGPTAARFIQQIEQFFTGGLDLGGLLGGGGGNDDGAEPGQVLQDLLRDVLGGGLQDIFGGRRPGDQGGGGSPQAPNPTPPTPAPRPMPPNPVPSNPVPSPPVGP
jgi:hypothetical protein